MNFDILKNTLEKDKRWYKVGECIFPNNQNNKDVYSGYLKLNDIKNEVSVSIKALDNLNGTWETTRASVTWAEFKTFSENHFEIWSLRKLQIQDTNMVYNLTTIEKEMIARELALLEIDWLEHFIDHLTETKRKEELKVNINNFRQRQNSPSNQLKELIFRIDPKYTVGKFHKACKDCHFNDTLNDLKTICTNYSIYKSKAVEITDS